MGMIPGMPTDIVDADAIFEQRLELARKLADQRQFSDAIVVFNWLCEAYPGRAAAVVDSANAFSRVYDYAGVAMRFAQVAARGSAPTEVWLAMAQISERMRRPQWTREFLANAVSNPNPSADACGLFALYLEHMNELDRASELYERGLKVDPSNATSQLAKAKVLRRRKSINDAATTIQHLLNNAGAPVRTRISALYEQAQLNDIQGDFGGAIRSLLAAKHLSSTLSEYAMFKLRAANGQRLHHQLLQTLNADYFKAAGGWQPSSPHRLAMLGGHPRSGTTLLEQVLDSHSAIVSAEETSIFGNGVFDPFTRELNGGNVAQASLAIDISRLEVFRSCYFSTMESLLDEPLGDRLLIDKNPSYTDCIPVFERVFPEAFYIIALRDPRDVVLSCFFQDLPVNDVTIHFQTLQDTAMRYANTMAMWLLCREQMDERKWIEVRYESLVTDLPGEAKKVMAKLNLPWQQQQERPQDHARTKPVISPTYAEVTKPVHTNAIGKWKRYEPWLADAMPILETFIEAFDY